MTNRNVAGMQKSMKYYHTPEPDFKPMPISITDLGGAKCVTGPAVIIAGSGMYTGGRIVSQLVRGLHDPVSGIIFAGSQAKNTPGRKMINIEIPCKAAIHKLSSYSAHADQRMLVDWVSSMVELPQEIRLVHGEEASRQALAEALPQEIPCRY
ncbi:MAG: MBL fold metallo-hydrolase RNA specificity domain-containing protein, partial [Desulfopila sp.]|nr:MBL fold metallo-hydrolase RNA specificity domain-containing protein [Desulfopila sp.]